MSDLLKRLLDQRYMAQSYVATGREAAAYIGRLKAALRDIRDMEVVDAGSMEAVQRAGAALSVETEGNDGR